MSFEAEQAIRRELHSGERLRWSGAPRRGIRLQPSDVILVPFSLLWAGFAFFWEWGVIRSGAPLSFALWGIPFVLMGLYMTIGRFFYDAWRRGRTYYGVTSERAIILDGGMNRQLRAVVLRSLSEVSVSERSGGSGTIAFGAATGPAAWFAGASWPGSGQHSPPAFEGIDRVRDVERHIREVQQGALLSAGA